jgi:class 3 adenylate cyclase/alpha-beta hydrolase superfamily lysophospholipase
MATEIPETQYAKTGDNVHIAYQIIGEGPLDVVLAPNWITHVEVMWEIPSIVRYLRRLASFARVIAYDQRGAGMSDPMPLDAPPTLEERMDEAVTVMDAAGSARAALIGFESGGPMAALFAASHPGRTSALVLVNSYARIVEDHGYDAGMPRPFMEAFFAQVVERWGKVDASTSPTSKPGPEAELWARYQRQAASPGTVSTLIKQLMDTDIRPALPTIQAPTLVLVHEHTSISRAVGRDIWRGFARQMADEIPGARYVDVPGEPGQEPDLNMFADEIREFLTGVREQPEADRVLATVLFSDIVSSTEHAASIGDKRWKEILDAHDEMVRRQLARFQGREVKALGDGFMATFDGPARAIRCASAIRDAAHRLGIEVRVGVHTGEVELRGEDVGGIGVHIAARVSAEASPSEILVSRTVCDLVVGSGMQFEDRGPRALKGVPGEWQLFAVAN